MVRWTSSRDGHCLQLLRAIVGFTIGLETFRVAGIWNRLSGNREDISW